MNSIQNTFRSERAEEHCFTPADLTEHQAEKNVEYINDSEKPIVIPQTGRIESNDPLHLDYVNHEEADTLLDHQAVLAAHWEPVGSQTRLREFIPVPSKKPSEYSAKRQTAHHATIKTAVKWHERVIEAFENINVRLSGSQHANASFTTKANKLLIPMSDVRRGLACLLTTEQQGVHRNVSLHAVHVFFNSADADCPE
ncbi:hypothetical protein LSAT2_018973 [Lamellibrachia satsuma]|nr:hypothetical protein LSAT2_018973 [Lamellibrachia satsuma]